MFLFERFSGSFDNQLLGRSYWSFNIKNLFEISCTDQSSIFIYWLHDDDLNRKRTRETRI